MSHPVNEEILENISENYQVCKVLDHSVGKKYFEIRDVTVAPRFFWEDANLIKHNNISSFPTIEDAKKALSEIAQERFEELSQ